MNKKKNKTRGENQNKIKIPSEYLIPAHTSLVAPNNNK